MLPGGCNGSFLHVKADYLSFRRGDAAQEGRVAAAPPLTQITALSEMQQQKKSTFLSFFSVNAELSTLVLV